MSAGYSIVMLKNAQCLKTIILLSKRGCRENGTQRAELLGTVYEIAKVGRLCLKVCVCTKITRPIGVFFVWIMVISPEIAMFFSECYFVPLGIEVDCA